MKLSSVLRRDLVFTHLEGEDRNSLYHSIIEKAAEALPDSFDVDALRADIVKREDETLIPYEKGLAFPHQRRSEYDDLNVILATLKTPILLKANDLAPTQVVVMSLISETTSDLYLKVIAAFAKFCMNPENVDALASADSTEAVFKLLDERNVLVKSTITAEDVMTRDFPSVRPTATVGEALDAFTREMKVQLPVVDDDGKLLGILDAAAVIAKYIPEYIMMMDNLNFLTSFEPFDNLFKHERKSLVEEFTRKPKCVVSLDAPLIQFTVTLAAEKARNVLVIDDQKRLMGVITIQEIINRVLRG